MRKLLKITCLIALCLMAAGKMNAQTLPAGWECDEHDYENLMTLFATVSIDGVAVDVADLQNYTLSAWKDGACRGVSEVWGQPEGLPSGKFVLHMFVRSNETSEDGISFKAYDAATGKTYAGNTTISFTNQSQQGKVTEPITIDLKAATPGDVDGDGTIDLTDAQYIFDFYMGEDVPAEFNEAAADFDGDGTVDLTDAQLVFEYYMDGD
jgi:hypothetical protein